MLILAFLFIFVISLSSFARVMISEKKLPKKMRLTVIIFLVMLVCVILELLFG